jgi:molybdopterin converting factor small subunit
METISITVQFFSQLKEAVGATEITLDLPSGSSVAELLARLYQDFPELAKWDRNLLIAAGLDFVERDHVIQPNDQLAIMPPVQGG